MMTVTVGYHRFSHPFYPHIIFSFVFLLCTRSSVPCVCGCVLDGWLPMCGWVCACVTQCWSVSIIVRERWNTLLRMCVHVCVCEQVINDKIIIKAKRKQKRNEFILVSHVKCHAAFMTGKWRDGSDGDGERAHVCVCVFNVYAVNWSLDARTHIVRLTSFFIRSAAKGKI